MRAAPSKPSWSSFGATPDPGPPPPQGVRKDARLSTGFRGRECARRFLDGGRRKVAMTTARRFDRNRPRRQALILSGGHGRSLAAPPAASRNFSAHGRSPGLRRIAGAAFPDLNKVQWREKRRHAAHSRGGGHGSAKSLPCSLFTLRQDRGTVRDVCSSFGRGCQMTDTIIRLDRIVIASCAVARHLAPPEGDGAAARVMFMQRRLTF